jgi:hypothetical protein
MKTANQVNGDGWQFSDIVDLKNTASEMTSRCLISSRDVWEIKAFLSNHH